MKGNTERKTERVKGRQGNGAMLIYKEDFLGEMKTFQIKLFLCVFKEKKIEKILLGN